jgi:hypothetical protein
MKLLLCPLCGDVKKLSQKGRRYCDCRKSWGAYKDDRQAVVGGYGLVLGIANSHLHSAMLAHCAEPDDQYTVGCWLFPEPHRTVDYARLSLSTLYLTSAAEE